MSTPTARVVPVIDISALVNKDAVDPSKQRAIGIDLVRYCHEQGFVGIAGHGIPKEMLQEAFSLMERLFGLPMEDKMKAPHPDGWTPHRGYSPPGREKAYTNEDMEAADEKHRQAMKKILDWKESYDMGSENNQMDYNIWLPEDVLPGFKKFTTELYWRLSKLCMTILEAFADGLDLSEAEKVVVRGLHSGHNNQLRLLHYPPISEDKVGNEMLGRCPAHTDFNTFTLLFQDSCGGLEFEDRKHEGDFIDAAPEEDTLYLNVGDMLMRLSNGYLPSANHRVTVPKKLVQLPSQPGRTTPPRYSMPYFFQPDNDPMIRPQRSCIDALGKQEFDGTTFHDYKIWRTEWIYAK